MYVCIFVSYVCVCMNACIAIDGLFFIHCCLCLYVCLYMHVYVVVAVVVVVYFILSRLLYLAYSANLGLLYM